MTSHATLGAQHDRPAADWEAALAALETSLSDTKALLANGSAPEDDINPALSGWQPPAGLGPLPAHLQERAQTLLAEQRATMESLQLRIETDRQHHQIAAAMAQTPPRPRAAFIDRTL